MSQIKPQLFLHITHVHAVVIPFAMLHKRVWSWWLLLVHTIRWEIPVKLNMCQLVWY